MSCLNLITHAVIDEVGLEGLDGITLESASFVLFIRFNLRICAKKIISFQVFGNECQSV